MLRLYVHCLPRYLQSRLRIPVGFQVISNDCQFDQGQLIPRPYLLTIRYLIPVSFYVLGLWPCH